MKPVTIDKPISELKPYEVKCSDTRCEQGFHYYTSKVAPEGGKVGDCKECGDDTVDWKRIYLHDPEDVEYTFDSLKKELLRHVCWVNEIDKKAILKAKQRGRKAIRLKAEEIIRKKLGHPIKSYFDKICTPKKGSEIINYGQHATATCCRICLERWHNIPQDVNLTEQQIDYCAGLIELFVNDRVPEITNDGDPQIKLK
jgi:hypothetical protein